MFAAVGETAVGETAVGEATTRYFLGIVRAKGFFG